MSFIRQSSPHTHNPSNTGQLMRIVLIACIPGLLAQTVFFGIGNIVNILIAATSAIAFEALVLKLRNKPVWFYLSDYSALVTAVLLGLALPAYCPWWITVVATFSAIVIAKQLYGGLGYNPFNPAMVGYVVVLISFPLPMSQWAGANILSDIESLSLVDSQLKPFVTTGIDGYTAATPLDLLKQSKGLMVEQLYQSETVFKQANWAGAGWEWVNIGFLLGGLYLLYRKVFTWHTPVAMLTVLALMAAFGYDGGSSNSAGSPLFHLLSGATMLGAFFIATDPVTSAVSTKGRLIYGGFIGLLVYVIRVWGNYPDALAFAILLMNFAAPFIDYYTLPRSYGHSKSRKATEKAE